MPGGHGAGDAPSQGDHHLNKRKRDGDDGRSDRIPQPPPPQSGNGGPINYLARSSHAKLPLIQGDSDSFSEVLSLLKEYEGILNRHESLAGNLGAKLTAPRLLRAMDGLFDGPILVSSNLAAQGSFPDGRVKPWYTPTWLEIVTFAKSNPAEFSRIKTTDGRRVRRFNMNNATVEITEDDWQLIMSGTVDQFFLAATKPLEQDEAAELVTLDILDQRVQTIIKKADEVARKARQLNYHLSGRKAFIESRQANSRQDTASGFQGVVLAPIRSGGPNAGYDIHADLLQQFTATGAGPAHQPASPMTSHPFPSIPNTHTHSPDPHRLRQIQNTSPSQQARPPPAEPRPPPAQSNSPVSRSESSALPVVDGGASENISTGHLPPMALIFARIEKLSRGDVISPPCDRCRRLQMVCRKKLTACDGCTRKHAKCSWTKLTDEEVGFMRANPNYVFPSRRPGDGEDEPTENSSDGSRIDSDLPSRQRIGFPHTTAPPPRADDARLDSRDSPVRNGEGDPSNGKDRHQQPRADPDADGLPRPSLPDQGPRGSLQHPYTQPQQQHQQYPHTNSQLTHLAFTAVNVAKAATSATPSVGNSRGSSSARE
ncbi:hypothetical protein QBC39DRAFT_116387 [Podospora conica]|nr:hypothetical protein QBC39DRAFT_116387 [Schizothecium conicum]